MIARGVFILGFGVAANIVLARLLAPRDFGLVALGTVLLVFGSFLSDGGLGAALLRRPQPPERRELAAVNALQLSITIAIALAFAVGGVIVGRDGLVVAVMVATLPISVLKTPSSIMLERQLEYRLLATVDVVEALSFYTWSLTAVALGMGVWGMATGMVVRALAGTSVMIGFGPIGPVVPRWSRDAIRPLLGFGLKFQANPVASMARDQTVNVGIAVVAGVSTLGVWNLAWRVLQVPYMVFGTVGRIGYPTMARLLGSGADPRRALERGLAALAVVTGSVIVAVVGFAPALPAVLGHAWNAVPAVLLWAGMALAASAPMSVGTSGYLYAADRAGTVVLSTCLGAAAWLAVGLSLLPAIGAPAVGVGWCASAVVQIFVLGRRTVATSGAAIGRSVVPPILAAMAAAASGFVTARALGHTVPAGLAGLAVAELVLATALFTIGRRALRDTAALVAGAVPALAERLGRRSAAPPSAAEPSAPEQPLGEVGAAALPVHGPSEGGVLARDARD